MSKAKRDLVIHYDEIRNVIVCYSTDLFNTEKIREKEFGLEVSVSEYKNVTSDEAEKMMGAGVFSLLDLYSISPIGVRNYEELGNDLCRESQQELEKDALLGDVEAQYCFAIDCFSEGVRNRNVDQIEQAEVWLKKAAASGFSDAVSYLNDHWERDKASALRRIQGA